MVTANDPEKEFLKTSLDACRSTLLQQETEIKKLKESLDIRNKRIMQLEEQIDFSATLISDRPSNANEGRPGPSLSTQDNLLHSLLEKLIDASCNAVKNININTGQTQTIVKNAVPQTEHNEELHSAPSMHSDDQTNSEDASQNCQAQPKPNLSFS